MRRLIIVEPMARSALWSRRFASLGALLAAVSVVASRGGVLDPPGALAVLGVGLCFAAAAVLAALVAAVVIWRSGHPGIGAAVGGTILACLLLAYPVWLAQEAARMPALSDVSTDPANPVPFSPLPKALAARRGVMHDPPSQAERQAQAAAYPDLQPLTLDLSAADLYKAALKLVQARRWRVIESQAPSGKPPVGHIEAVARSTIMGFPDDVTIRIAAIGANQARLDMRSASRFGHRDLGANAARIAAFTSELEDTADQE